MENKIIDIAIIGGGPAGLSAYIGVCKKGLSALLVEREDKLGGVLKQCIHDGFGLVKFKKKMSGSEYAGVFIAQALAQNGQILLNSFVNTITKNEYGYELIIINDSGVIKVQAKKIIFATGCRERTSKQVGIHGARPSGVFTAGTAQYYVNILGAMPLKKCVILGSGDIGLIMARRLSLEGAEVLGVYEAKNVPSGLYRNISQCLDDFGIVLHLSKTVSRLIGKPRLKAVEIVQVDEKLNHIKGTEEIIECDSLILSVGLIPENELIETLLVPVDNRTKGAIVDQGFESMQSGIYVCGNALHVNDLVDYVSESAEIVARDISDVENYLKSDFIDVEVDANLAYALPQKINLQKSLENIVFYFRVSRPTNEALLTIKYGQNVLRQKSYDYLRVAEMQRIVVDCSEINPTENSKIEITLKEV